MEIEIHYSTINFLLLAVKMQSPDIHSLLIIFPQLKSQKGRNTCALANLNVVRFHTFQISLTGRSVNIAEESDIFSVSKIIH